MSVEIVRIEHGKSVKTFIDFPHLLYKDDPNYVPEIYIAVEEILNRNKNPFFDHSEAEYFIAWKGEKMAGRIAAVLNRSYNDYHQSNVGFFGFFDTIDDVEVSAMLLSTVEKWCKDKGLDAVLGPANFTTNETAGLLVEGFHEPPIIQMTYNKPYYSEHLERAGYNKEMDLHAYWIPTNEVSEKSLRLSHLLKERLDRRGITFRSIKMKNFKHEIQDVKEVYRSAWQSNWGFVPPTDREFDHLAQGLKMIIDDRYVYIAEEKGKMVGFAVGLPNINETVINIKKGRLLPFGIFKLLFGKRKVKKVRIALLGVLEEYRKLGIEAVFFANFIQAARQYNLIGGEASWVLENNEMMVKAAENLNGKKYKVYRIYKKSI